MRYIDWETNQNGCWICTSHKRNYSGGYPQLSTGGLISRFIWKECFGEIPPENEVCHKCDDPGCINPEHLYIATHSENIKDMVRKGRANTSRGENHYFSKLKTEDVIDIRNLYNKGVKFVEIARKYNISATHASQVARGKYWKCDDRLIRTSLTSTD